MIGQNYELYQDFSKKVSYGYSKSLFPVGKAQPRTTIGEGYYLGNILSPG